MPEIAYATVRCTKTAYATMCCEIAYATMRCAVLRQGALCDVRPPISRTACPLYHTPAQYRTPHSTLCYLSTAHRIAPYAMTVPHIA
eukprot:2329454-Rhodomonas_salina.2